MSNLSRRDFMILSGAAALASSAPLSFAQKMAQGKITAGEVVDRIKQHLDIPWNDKTFRDTFKAGTPDMAVTGIATSFGGNYRVLKQAADGGMNMLIIHEPTFYSDADVRDWIKDDPLYLAKLDWINKQKLIIWRIHDHWHRHKPDGVQTGWDNHSGWNQYLVPGSITAWKLPPTTLGELAKYIAKTFDTKSVRVIGDPNLPVTNLVRGGHLLAQNSTAIKNADAILVSETREYDTFEYIHDVVYSGQKKGAIFISHSTGEDEGMRYMAEWLTPFVPEVPIKFIPTTDEFWTV